MARTAYAKKVKGFYLSNVQHCLDVACCFVALLDNKVIRQRIETMLGVRLTLDLRDRLAVIAFLHDAGKLSSGFQERIQGYGEGTGHLVPFMQVISGMKPEIWKAMGLDRLLTWGMAGDSGEQSSMLLLLASQAHHGRPAEFNDSGDWSRRGWYDPLPAARDYGAAMQKLFPRAFKANAPELSLTPQFQHYFIGLLTLADQIGSMQDVFTMGRESHDKRATLRIARRTVRRVGLWNGKILNPDLPWAEVFGWGDGASLKPMQQAMLEIPDHAQLAILESETGSGKTEASIVRFIHLWKQGKVDGLYFAVPTRTAAVQLHRRIDQAIRKICENETVLAVPGVPRVGAATGDQLPGFEVRWDDNPRRSRQMERWSAETSRRYLAARIAVGTVDQVMSSALQRKWAHMRGSALSRSLLVIDEVHASDPYMRTVIRQLLKDHKAIGGHALLMSATLGSHARATLLETPVAERLREPEYPAISWKGLDGDEEFLFPERDLRKKKVDVTSRRIMEDPEAIAELALQQYEAGGRVLIIRNTIRSAVAVFEALRLMAPGARMLEVNGVCTLHHSRFCAEDRKRLDDAVEVMLGKGSSNEPCIVIGTQTLEQSLDIDADLLISDLCPVDVLLQRIGRIHRHERGDRAPGFQKPRAVIVAPAELSPAHNYARLGIGPIGRNQPDGVYPNLLGLHAVLDLIEEYYDWIIPEMNRFLVEQGTDPEILGALAQHLGGVWANHHRKQESHARGKTVGADMVLMDRSQFMIDGNELFAAEEHAKTRLGEMGFELELPDGHMGSFGLPVKTILIPFHFCSDEVAITEAVVGEGQLALGLNLFTLDERGLLKVED